MVTAEDSDLAHMRRALGLAERGRGRTSPNPMVGALVVDRDGIVIGRGAHERAGGPHAEVFALREAGARASGATLFCTLEPCSHTGRTGPCAPLVADAGIARAVVAMEDPDPRVSGRGLEHLRARGLDVVVGVGRSEAERLNEAFLTRVRVGRPLVTVKIALSRDGRIAPAPGQSIRLTGPLADRHVHRQRAEVDAIAVGSTTVLVDDPQLTARGVYRDRPLTRVVFDARLRTPPTARLFSTLDAGPVIVVTTAEGVGGHPSRARALCDAGARVEVFDGRDLVSALRALAAMDVTSLVVEGGAALHRSFFDARIVDIVQAYVTPQTLGSDGVGWLEDGTLRLAALHERREVSLGDDVLIEGHVHGTD